MATVSRTSHRVVVALLDGKRERGFVYNFSPNAGNFYLFPTESADASFARLVELAECKAIFFVKSHEGNKAYREAMRKVPGDIRQGRVRGHRMRITFSDGEELLASSENYNPVRLGFFVYPLDPRSNNLRIFIINGNVRQVTTGRALQDPAGTSDAQPRMARSEPPAPARAPRPALPPPEPRGAPPPADSDCNVPLERRVEAVLRVIAGESPLAVSEEMQVPAGVLVHWSQVFLSHGRTGLTGAVPPPHDPRDSLISDLEARLRFLEAELERLRAAAARADSKR